MTYFPLLGQFLGTVHSPDDNRIRNLADSFQHASETRYAPMLVSGSSVSMMVQDALGGLLSGRFQSWHLKPLSQEYAIDLIFRLGKNKGIPITEDLALVIWELTQGYPYSIERILLSLSPDLKRLPDVSMLNNILFFELTDGLGALRKHYESQYGKYIHELNGDDTTRKILFWIANHPDERIFPDKIANIFGLIYYRYGNLLINFIRLISLNELVLAPFGAHRIL